MKVLLTGMAGFIGHHVCGVLRQAGVEVVGIDNLNSYYDVNLKLARLSAHGLNVRKIFYGNAVSTDGIRFYQMDLEDETNVRRLFEQEQFDVVCNLAAQAGVRYSIDHPREYLKSNLDGFFNIMDLSRLHGVSHFVYASSSSVYGSNKHQPLCECDPLDSPLSFYAATKKSNELMAHSYASIYGMAVTGLRFFSVYGPLGRPDMALFKFTKAILEGKAIQVYNHGDMQRDFTYVDDIAEGVGRIIRGTRPSSNAYEIYNIGHGSPVPLMDFIHAIECELGRKAEMEYLPMQAGDVPRTWASTEKLQRDYGFAPRVSVEEGVRQFIRWYRDYYRV